MCIKNANYPFLTVFLLHYSHIYRFFSYRLPQSGDLTGLRSRLLVLNLKFTYNSTKHALQPYYCTEQHNAEIIKGCYNNAKV